MSPPLVPGGTHSLAGGPNSDEGTDTVVLSVYKYFVIMNTSVEAPATDPLKILAVKLFFVLVYNCFLYFSSEWC